jgi:hypothetical protein
VNEAHALAFEYEDPLMSGDVERIADDIGVAEDGRDELDRWSSRHGHGEHDLADLVRQTREALAEQRAETVWHAEAQSTLHVCSRARQLQREERVAARRVMEQSHVGRAELSFETRPEELVQGALPQRTQREPRDPLPRKRSLELERHSGVRLLAQRHEHGPRLAERGENVRDCQADRVRIRRLAVRFGEQESHVECPPARARERGRDTVQHPREQLGQAGKGKHRLRLDAAPGEQPSGVLAGILARELP